jgi:D-methionine transport system permease protein
MSPITELVLQSTWETVVMVFFSTLFAVLLGFPLGIFLFVTSPRGIAPKIVPYQLISRIVNTLRSFPFVILMIVMFPLSRVVLGTAIGTEATIIPLSVAAAPFIARLTETALNEVDKGVIQAAVAMGASKRQVVRKVMIPEALPSIISGVTLTIITLIGYSAMAGAIGGGGLGDLAIRYGYQRFRTDVMIESVIIIIVMVEVIQFLGNKAATLVAKYPLGSFSRSTRS